MKPEDALGKLVGAIEKVAPATWETMVSYQRVSAVVGGLISLTVGLLALAALACARKGYLSETHPSDREPWVFGMVASVVVALACLVIGVPLYVEQFFTPEYHAIKEFMEVVK